MNMERRRGDSRQRESFATFQGKLQPDERSELWGVLPFAVIGLIVLIGLGPDVTAHVADDVRAAHEGAGEW